MEWDGRFPSRFITYVFLIATTSSICLPLIHSEAVVAQMNKEPASIYSDGYKIIKEKMVGGKKTLMMKTCQ